MSEKLINVGPSGLLTWRETGTLVLSELSFPLMPLSLVSSCPDCLLVEYRVAFADGKPGQPTRVVLEPDEIAPFMERAALPFKKREQE